jgi:dethiobiotin synthetase
VTSSRPRRLVVVSGTGTDVGKTWWTAAAATELRAGGLSVAARKPAQSFAAPDRPPNEGAPGEGAPSEGGPGEVGPGETDASVLGAATDEDATTVCPAHRWYETAMAPPMAASALGRPGFTVHDLVAELTWPHELDVGFVESAGGPRSPLADDGDTVALAAALAPDMIVLVADAGLGTINAVRLCVDVLEPSAPVVVALNRYDDSVPLHRANRDWLRARAGGPVVTDVADLAALVRDLP